MSIEIESFDITAPGDPSVGIFQTTWTLTGPFYFEDLEDRASFESELLESMRSLMDDQGAYIRALDSYGVCVDGEPEL